MAEFAEVLRQSYWSRKSSLTTVCELAQQVSALLPDDADVTEFINLVAQAERLAASQ